MMEAGIIGLITLVVTGIFGAETNIETIHIMVCIMWATIAICGAIRRGKK